MRLGSKLTALVLAGAVLLGARSASAKLRVVATIETLADLCRQVGGDRIDVTSLSHGYQDPHFVEAKPSLVLTLNRADALVYVGLDLEIGWLPPLVQQSRNPRHPARAAGKHRRLDGDQGRGRAEHPRRSAARPRRHPPARQSALLDPAQERPRDRARPRAAIHRARRRGGGRLPGRPGRVRAPPRRQGDGVGQGRGAAARPQRGHLSQELVVRGRVAQAARRSATSSRSRGSRPPPITPRSSSSSCASRT